MIIDTHAHLYAEEFSEDQPEVFMRAKAAGVNYFLLPNIDSASIPLMEKLLQSQKKYNSNDGFTSFLRERKLDGRTKNNRNSFIQKSK